MARKTGGSSSGSTLVEHAIVLPALLMFLLAIADAGRLMWSNATLSSAVAAAARCGAVNPSVCGSTTAIQSYAVSQAWGITIAASAFTVTTPACGTQVQGTLVFSFVIPWFYVAGPFGASNTMTLSATSCYPP
jgi:Flp pilus assembly protein TadG